MPSKDHDVDDVPLPVDASPSQQRRSKSDRKPDHDHKHKHRHHSSKDARLGGRGSETSSPKQRSSKRKDNGGHGSSVKERSVSASDLGSKMWPVISVDRQRASLPYPSFSKAHSKEAVLSRDDISSQTHASLLTPEPTDVGEEERRSKSAELSRNQSASKKAGRPPTPPETDVSADKRRGDGHETEFVDSEVGESLERPKSRASGPSRSGSRGEERSRISRKSASSSQATYVKTPTHKSHDKLRAESRGSSSSRASTRHASSRRGSKQADTIEADSSPSTAQRSSPKTPVQPTHLPAQSLADIAPDPSPSPDHGAFVDASIPSKTATPSSQNPTPAAAPNPPPPPPPAVDIQDTPRVDYLLQNGGLPHPAPKSFLGVLPRQNGMRPSDPPPAGADTLFAPFFNLLDQYSAVLAKHGSIAVATGHRSVARRLLDRLEHVFSRDLPPHGCVCVMCERSQELHRGLTWGDVLEWVSGRIELPRWPPFDLAEIGTRAAEICAETPRRPASPVKLDPDIAEEFREHYLRQTKKVRSTVDKWLSKTGETPVPPPQDVDDETLTFAIMTNLDPEDRPLFNAMLTGSKELRPVTRAPTPLHRHRTDHIVKSGLSLQRLYRLPHVPRDAETAAYLVENPQAHDLLVTLSNINNSEWEILTSGRFDGFLWSGADGDDAVPIADSRETTPANFAASPAPKLSPGSAMRNMTPFSMHSRDGTPASFMSRPSSVQPGGRLPVSNDEEMEIAAIAEIEREIYTGMESLEDVFEKLHQKAEAVRTALRQRGAGLMQNLQNRRRIDVLPNPGPGISQTPAHDRSGWSAPSDVDQVSDSEWGLDDVDLGPEDSASNISSSRHRRPKRRTERRTPAPIEEEDERW